MTTAADFERWHVMGDKRMIASPKIQQVQRLLIEGNLSQRKIAAIVGIGRATVSQIAKGKRTSYEDYERPRIEALEAVGPLARCPGCGGMVYTPCRLCRVRELKAHEEALARAHRRRARQESLRRLLTALRNACQARGVAVNARGYLPVAADREPSDCR
jgi:transcriptional regulator with XRE-family HTH domain